MNNSPAFTNLSFVMVDLTPKMHYGLTTGSLLSTATDNLYYFSSVIDKSCNTCRTGIQVSMSNLPLHSRFKDTHYLIYPNQPQEALVSNLLPNWETAKKKWSS
jgi:hypothetical protein